VRPKRWWSALGTLVSIRLAIPLVALSASGSDLPGLPEYTYAPLNGDAFGYYAAARETLAAAGRVPVPVVLGLGALLAAAALTLRRTWRGPSAGSASSSVEAPSRSPRLWWSTSWSRPARR